MKEGDISHDEVNAAVAGADKTIVFARQNRLKDGLLLGDDKLPRFHAGHDTVKFFYSSVRQLPEYFLDALLARDISVTLVLGRGLVCFKDVRNWQAVHTGRTRRTIYLPERILDIAANNGYDYWSIAHILITEGWKLLDYVLLLEMIEAVQQRMLETRVTVVGVDAFRRLLKRGNRHRSSYESPAMMELKKKTGMDVPINEADEFSKLYEPRFVRQLSSYLEGGKRVMRRSLEADEMYDGTDPGVSEEILDLFVEGEGGLSSDGLTKALYDDYQEEIWAQRKAAEVFEEQGFPDYFLLDRDILHPAAREMAEAAGQEPAARTMREARHDYVDALRFGIGTESWIERLVGDGVRFGPEGIEGLMEQVIAPLFESGRTDEKLLDWLRRILRGSTTKEQNLAIYFERGMEVVRFRETLRFWVDVKKGKRELRLEDFETVRSQMVSLASGKAQIGDTMRLQIINSITDVRELFDNYRGLIIGEAHRLVDDVIETDSRGLDSPSMFAEFSAYVADPRETEQGRPPSVRDLIDEEMEKAVVRCAMCLDQAPEFQQIIGDLVSRGGRAVEVMEEYVAEVAGDPEQQNVVINARQAIADARGGSAELEEGLHEDHEILFDLVRRVKEIMELVPERYHSCTSGMVSPLRRAIKDFETIRGKHLADTNQLGHLAMALVRLNRAGGYDVMLDHIRWMRHYALGELLQARGDPLPSYTPGLLKVIYDVDQGPRGQGEGAEAQVIAETATELAEELSGKKLAELNVARKVL